MLIRHRRVFRDHLPPLRERTKPDYAGLACDYVKLIAVVSVALLALWLIWRL